MTTREIAWARATYAAVQPHLTGGAYANFMGVDDDDADAYRGTLAPTRRGQGGLRPRERVPPQPEREACGGGMSAAAVQRRLWGTDPQAWADLAEPHNRPLFEAVLDAAQVGDGTRVLDVGCGSGLTLVLARERGAVPSGIDISPGLLGVARERLPDADLREGDMETLPFADDAFDAVLGVNAFQFAGDPERALREAARVVGPRASSRACSLRQSARRAPSCTRR